MRIIEVSNGLEDTVNLSDISPEKKARLDAGLAKLRAYHKAKVRAKEATATTQAPVSENIFRVIWMDTQTSTDEEDIMSITKSMISRMGKPE